MRVISGEARGHTLKAPKGMTTRPMADKIKGALYSMLSGLLSSTEREWGRVLDMYAGSGSIGIEALSRGAEWADFVEVNAGVCRVIADNLEHTKFSERSRVNNRNVAAFLNHPPGPPATNLTKRAAGGLHRRKGGKNRPDEPLNSEIAFVEAPNEAVKAPPVLKLEGHNGQLDSQQLWQYDIIFLDPPYADPKIPATIAHVARSGLVKAGGLVVIGHSPRVVLASSYGELDSDHPGAIVLHLLRHRRHGDSAFSIFLAGEPRHWGFATEVAGDTATEVNDIAEDVRDDVSATDFEDYGDDAEGE